MGSDPGLNVDRGDRVRDDVVQLARDPQPLGVDPAASFLLTGSLGALGAVTDLGHERAAVGHCPSQEQRRAQIADRVDRGAAGALMGERDSRHAQPHPAATANASERHRLRTSATR